MGITRKKQVICELEAMLERTLNEARNSHPEQIEIYVSKIYALQDQYQSITGERYKFKEMRK